MNIKTTCLIFAFLLLHAFTSWGDGFNLLWNKYNDAKSKDLPQTELNVLGQIIKKAEQEKSYGNLLAAEVSRAAVRCTLSPDSIEADTLRLRRRINSSTNVALAAVWRVSLGKIYSILDRNTDTNMRTQALYRAAMEHPQILAATQAKGYEPLLTKGTDSRIFGDDLLHVIAMETEMYDVAGNYYKSQGNRPAAMFMAMWQAKKEGEQHASKLVGKLDSIMSVYDDLPDCGYVAAERYKVMEHSSSVREQISFIDYATAHWPICPGISELQNARISLTRPSFDLRMKNHRFFAGTTSTIVLEQVRNLHEVKVKISRLKDVDGRTSFDGYDKNELKKLRAKTDMSFKPVVLSCRFTPPSDWEYMTDSMTVPALPAGIYLLEASADDPKIDSRCMLLYGSRLAMVWESLPKGSLRIGVMDAVSGQPVKNAHIVMKQGYYNEMKQSFELTTDDKGEAITSINKNYYFPYWVYTDNDKFAKTQYGWYGNAYYDNEGSRKSHSAEIFTDRGIYRPGQTVHVSFIGYQQDDLNVKADSNATIRLTLSDNDGQVISKATIKTDEWGTASADFELPRTLLTGRMLIQANGDNSLYAERYVQVEEYKRPTFKVEVAPYEQRYAAGDTLSLQGTAKTYSGVAVAGAKVNYTVVRRRALWCWWTSDRSAKTIYEGSTTTLTDGTFNMQIPLTMPDLLMKSSRWGDFYNFEVTAKVTDNGGETHQGYSTLPLGTKEAVLTSNLPQKALVDSLRSIKFIYQNAAGKSIDGEVTYTIDGKKYRAKTNIDVELGVMKSGSHKLIAVCGNDTLRQEIVTFSIKDKKPVVKTSDWFYVSNSQFSSDSQPVYVQVGSSDNDFHILYSIVTADKVIENGVIDNSNALITRAFTYKKEYGDGITLTYTWVKNGKVYKHQANIERPLPDKRLQVEWNTFRDKLTPGQKEEWTLTVKRNGKPALAQFMATMYDASLDQISNYSWPFRLSFTNRLAYVNWNNNLDDDNNRSLSLSAFIEMQHVSLLQWRTFDSSFFSDFYMIGGRDNNFGSGIRIRGNQRMLKQNMTLAAMPEAAAPAKEETKLYDIVDRRSSDTQENTTKEVTLRENMQETAFFYPNLLTDNKGQVSIRFTLPESVTTWRLLGLAHDKEMNYGTITAEAVAQKAVMVQPNLPRFIRVGDNPTVSVRIFNTQSHPVSGTVSFLLMDANSEEKVCEQHAEYNINANGSTSALFNLAGSSFAGHDMLIARVTAKGNGYSDGEQDYLPVLPNKEMVTNTLPFTQNTVGVKTIDMSKLFPKDATQKKLTIEYTNNPAWLMVQALPFMAQVDEQNALSLSAALYANSIGAYIMKAQPQMKRVVDQWRMEKGNETSMMSNLEKNTELSQQLLSETPWTLDAQNEREQRMRLARFFDDNSLMARQTSLSSSLAKLQNANGSFSWWKGMSGSYAMTTAVVKTLVRLNKLIGNQTSNAEMLTRAFSYLDVQTALEVKELKKMAAKGIKRLTPSETACDYLYACALSGRKSSADIAYLVNLLKAMPTQLTIYGKANSAVILAAYGQQAKAKEYLQSLREYTVKSQELGCYFDTPKAYYSWFDYRIPTQTAAIEALQLLTPNDPNIKDMKCWLLQEKRTQAWDTPINSVNAVYAFLKGNMQVLDEKPATQLYVDGDQLKTGELTAGTGYIKIPNAPMGKILEAKKSSSGTSWGAVYAQFMQPAAQIDNAASGLSITRQVIANGKNINDLKVGDKVKVRITIKASRDFDFVEVQDKRAACLEPVSQLSGYLQDYYIAPHDNATNYYFDCLAKGTHVIETEYYIDRQGEYNTGTCTVQCAYAPEYSGREKAKSIVVKQ